MLMYLSLRSRECSPEGGRSAELVKKYLTDSFRDRSNIKKDSLGYEQYHRDLSNGYVSRNREQPFDVSGSSR